MGHLWNTNSSDLLTADDDTTLLTNDLPTPPPPSGPTFPTSLMLRMRIHACWLLFLLLSS